MATLQALHASILKFESGGQLEQAAELILQECATNPKFINYHGSGYPRILVKANKGDQARQYFGENFKTLFYFLQSGAVNVSPIYGNHLYTFDLLYPGLIEEKRSELRAAALKGMDSIIERKLDCYSFYFCAGLVEKSIITSDEYTLFLRRCVTLFPLGNNWGPYTSHMMKLNDVSEVVRMLELGCADQPSRISYEGERYPRFLRANQRSEVAERLELAAKQNLLLKKQ